MFSPAFIAKQAKLLCKQSGVLISVHWSEWPEGSQPETDPTSGAAISPEVSPVTHGFTTRALIHTVSSQAVQVKRFAELQEGDLIVDLFAELRRITFAGDTAFAVGDVVDEYAFNAANRNLAVGKVQAMADVVEIESLGHPVVFIVNGKKWKHKRIVADDLAGTYDSTVRDKRLAKTIALELLP